MLCQVHHTFQPIQSDLWRCTHTGECQVWMFFSGVLFRERVREFFFWASRTHDFLQWQADQAAQGEQAALSKICEAEYHTRLPLEEQKKPLSEARSEMNLQESRVESADRALRESRPQVWSDIVTAPQPLGLRVPWPGVIWWQNRDTRRRLHTFSSPGDEHVRSAVFLRFPCEHHHTGVMNWINSVWKSPTCQPMTSLSEFIAKQVLCQPGLCSR